MAHDEIMANEEKEKTLAEFLKEKRRIKNLSLEKLASLTKIQIYYLEAIENGEYDKLPPAVYREGIFSRLAKFLDADKNKIAEMYGREAAPAPAPAPQISQDRAALKKPAAPFLTPKKIAVFIGVLLLISISAYLVYQFKFLVGPPNLAMDPKGDIIVNQDSIKIEGKTDSGVYLTINGENIFVDSDGNFSKDVQLAAGENSIDVKAVNRLGKSTEIVRHILRQTQ